jgi:hypothetical protein
MKMCYLAFQLCSSGSPYSLSHVVDVKDLQTSSNVPAYIFVIFNGTEILYFLPLVFSTNQAH